MDNHRISVPCKSCRSLLHNSDRSKRTALESLLPTAAKFTCSNCGRKQLHLNINRYKNDAVSEKPATPETTTQLSSTAISQSRIADIKVLRKIMLNQNSQIKLLESEISRLKYVNKSLIKKKREAA